MRAGPAAGCHEPATLPVTDVTANISVIDVTAKSRTCTEIALGAQSSAPYPPPNSDASRTLCKGQ
eukprot:3073330-Prymnesium_polylepis.1